MPNLRCPAAALALLVAVLSFTSVGRLPSMYCGSAIVLHMLGQRVWLQHACTHQLIATDDPQWMEAHSIPSAAARAGASTVVSGFHYYVKLKGGRAKCPGGELARSCTYSVRTQPRGRDLLPWQFGAPGQARQRRLLDAWRPRVRRDTYFDTQAYIELLQRYSNATRTLTSGPPDPQGWTRSWAI
jgi:hypothetical protein